MLLVLPLLDGVLEKADELDAGVVDRVALLDGDALGPFVRRLLLLVEYLLDAFRFGRVELFAIVRAF